MIPSFNQISLTNNLVSASGGQLTIGANTVLYQGSGITISGTTNYGSMNLNPILNSGIVTLGNNPCYVFTGNQNVVWALPSINSCTGRMYFIKNRGTSVFTLSGNGTDKIYSNSGASIYQPNPSEAYILFNDGYFWEIM